VEVQTAQLRVDLPTTQPLPDPTPIRPSPFKWKVLPPDEDGVVRYGLSVKDYESLSRTMAEVMRWVTEAQWRLDYYRAQLARPGAR
jgi:hypothetical protein